MKLQRISFTDCFCPMATTCCCKLFSDVGLPLVERSGGVLIANYRRLGNFCCKKIFTTSVGGKN